MDIPTDGKENYDVLGYIYEYLISKFASSAGNREEGQAEGKIRATILTEYTIQTTSFMDPLPDSSARDRRPCARMV